MNDKEYKDFLEALARKHLQIGLPTRRRFLDPRELSYYSYELDRLMWLTRFHGVAAERPYDPNVVTPFADKLRERSNVDRVIRLMRDSGAIDALEDAPDLVSENLRMSVIPAEDLELLRRAGIQDPELEINITIQYTREHVGTPPKTTPNRVVQSAPEVLQSAANRVEETAKSEDPQDRDGKNRKVWNGIGKILQGAILGAGNVLIATGTILAPNPAIAAGAVASTAWAVGGMCQGIGDLRGEVALF